MAPLRIAPFSAGPVIRGATGHYGRLMSDSPPSTAFVEAVTEQALLKLSPERLTALAAAAAPTHAKLRTLAAVDLGETAPATSFDASWD